MIIRSKYMGNCPNCGRRYYAGDRIEWNRGEPTTHASCYIRSPQAVLDLLKVGGGFVKIEFLREDDDRYLFRKEFRTLPPKIIMTNKAGERIYITGA